jgi:hypothetical protein
MTQGAQPPEPGWYSFVAFLEQNQPVIDLLIVLAWAFFIYYTIKTFRQIKRQTDLQSDAFLVVAAETDPDVRSIDRIASVAREVFNRWQGILELNVPAALERGESTVVLRLNNRGVSDIVSWKIHLAARVEPSDYLAEHLNITHEEKTWTIEQHTYDEVIPPGDDICIAVARTGVFPHLRLTWTIEYKDLRDKQYTRFAGDKNFTDQNIFANPQTREEAEIPEPEPEPEAEPEPDEAAEETEELEPDPDPLGFDVDEDDLPF